MSETQVISSFFSNITDKTNSQDICDKFLHLVDELNNNLNDFNMPPSVHCVYNPTIYARHTFEMYVRKYCSTRKPIMYLGMNPGPWGMSQTGVPFGEISSIKDWLGIQGPVGKPSQEIQSRPVKGFECTRKEESGKRFWGFFKNLCGVSEKFFETSFVYNYLPQQWMKTNGTNLTPEVLKANEAQQLYSICDPILRRILDLYDVKIIVAIGRFCETRAQKSLEKYMSANSIKIVYMPHPSPRSGSENKWCEQAHNCLKNNNLLRYYQKDNQTAT